ncbi:hypothetical protein ACFV0C_38145 [Streptomyces sp. NPDC059568]|uniref:hypothetical protein n=1 Tax=Streptomyces sp. NPDC059568 TaxID=3346868 RepID=UPI0036BAC17F
MAKRSYREPGTRTRRSYHLTQSGRDLAVPLAALQVGPSVERRSPSGDQVRVGFLDEADGPVAQEDLAFIESTHHSDH